MAFPSISNFKAAMRFGGARPSNFQIEITWPISVPVGLAASKDAPWKCQMAEIPGESVSQVTTKYAGREIKFAGVRVYDNLRLTFLNDEDFIVRDGLNVWMDHLNTRESNISLTQPTPTADGYSGTAVVKQYNKSGQIIKIYTFVECFPIRVDPIQLDWNNDAQIETYGVEFAYQYWVPGSLSTSVAEIASAAIQG